MTRSERRQSIKAAERDPRAGEPSRPPISNDCALGFCWDCTHGFEWCGCKCHRDHSKEGK